MAKRRSIRCFDLCCGAGALSEGFRRGGAEIVGGLDVNAQALSTARRNCPGGTWQRESIEELAASLDRPDGHPIWTANTLLAGLPCQGFSRAGKRDPNDPRNSLYKHLLRLVAKTQPQHVVFENVVGMTTAKTKGISRSRNGRGRTWPPARCRGSCVRASGASRDWRRWGAIGGACRGTIGSCRTASGGCPSSSSASSI